jgi:hypothetical protein
VVISFPPSVTVSPTTGVIDEAIDVSGFTITNQGQGPTSGSVRIGMYLSTDSVITSADTLMETFTTPGSLLPGGQQFFPMIEGDTNSVDIPKVAPGTYFVGYLADDVGQVFETNEANNYVSAASAQLTVVADLVITTTSLPGGTVGTAYTSTQLTATGGVGPYHWVTEQSGPLPAGMVLSDDGVISGTPKVGGDFPVQLVVKDSASNPHFASKTLQLVVITPGPGVPALEMSAGNVQTPTAASQRSGAVAPSASSRRRASWTSGSPPATSAGRMRRNSE